MAIGLELEARSRNRLQLAQNYLSTSDVLSRVSRRLGKLVAKPL